MSLFDLVIAVLIGLVIFSAALWAVRAFAAPVPEREEVVPVEADYRCEICGTRLTVTHAPGSEISAPRHCREEMEREW